MVQVSHHRTNLLNHAVVAKDRPTFMAAYRAVVRLQAVVGRVPQ
jgi:hypothetical protein